MDETNKKRINIDEISKVNQFGVAYRNGEFLLIFNATNEDFSDGTAFLLPAKELKTIADGLKQSGIKYQQKFSQDIGFTEE